MNTIFQTTTKNFDVISVIETLDNYFLTCFNGKIVSEDMTFIQALHEVENQMSL